MENLYTEKALKKFNKTQLLDIAIANDIEVNIDMKNDTIIALILEKGCPIPAEEGTEPPENNCAGDSAPETPAKTDDSEDGDTEDTSTKDESVPKFSKGQLLSSHHYSHRRDVLKALLADGKMYSHGEVGKLISNFMKGKVK